MNKAKIFTKVSALLLGLGLWTTAIAEEDPNDGKYWYTAQKGLDAIEMVDEFKLYFRTTATVDSMFWRIQGEDAFLGGNLLLAKTDLKGAVYYKIDNLWMADSFAYNGIISYGDTVLAAPAIEGATYIWSYNDSTLASTNFTTLASWSGRYAVHIIQNAAPHDTLRYSYYINEVLPGDTRNNPIRDTNLIGHDLNYFWVPNDLSAQWSVEDRYVATGNRFLMLNDGLLSAHVYKNGKWYNDFVSFKGIRTDGFLLRANVSAAKYQWYKDGNPVGGNSSSIDLLVYGKGAYSLVATFNTANGVETGTYYDFSGKGQGTFSNPITTYSWIKRSGDVLAIQAPANMGNYFLAFWRYQTVGGEVLIDSSASTFVLNGPTTVTAIIYSNGLWYQDSGFFATDSNDLGSFENPIDTTLIEQEGFTLSLPAHLHGDSIVWFVFSRDTLLTKDYIYFGTSVELYNNAVVIAHVKHNGLWYAHELDYKGIVRNQESNALQAPIIKDAQYEWFFNGNALGVYSPSYEPTVAGTYKVVINWVESGASAANERVAQTQKTAVFTFVVDALTGVEEDNQMLAALSLYPNPAQDSFVFEGNMQSIDYRIEDVRSVVVKLGQTAAGVAVSLQDLQPGIYLVHMKAGHASATKRLIVR